jgi:hypothetical protein
MKNRRENVEEIKSYVSFTREIIEGAEDYKDLCGGVARSSRESFSAYLFGKE